MAAENKKMGPIKGARGGWQSQGVEVKKTYGGWWGLSGAGKNKGLQPVRGVRWGGWKRRALGLASKKRRGGARQGGQAQGKGGKEVLMHWSQAE